MQALKRWMTFLIIMGILLITMSYMFLNKQTVYYRPQTDNPSLIYKEACQHCHGDRGQGTGLFYPGLVEEDMTGESIADIIQNGSFLMAAYVNIKGDTLQILSDYIYRKGFLKPYFVPADSLP